MQLVVSNLFNTGFILKLSDQAFVFNGCRDRTIALYAPKWDGFRVETFYFYLFYGVFNLSPVAIWMAAVENRRTLLKNGLVGDSFYHCPSSGAAVALSP